MDGSLQPLLDRAFGIADATNANSAIADARAAAPGAKPSSYELVVADGQSLAELAHAIIPRLVYHLESIGARPPQWGDVFLSLFIGARLHFVRTVDAMPLLLEAAQLTADQALARYGTGEVRHRIDLHAERKPLLLGTGPSHE